MRKLFGFIMLMLCFSLLGSAVLTVQHSEIGRFPVMTAVAFATGGQDGISQDGNLAVSSERGSLYYDYGSGDANTPAMDHYFLPIHRSVETLFDVTKRYDAGQAIGCQSTRWRSGLDTRPDAIIVFRHDGNPNTRDAGRRLLV